ncbi:hypothetical protein ABFT23_03050 [Nocardioides sp. C4-1]|uniref:hypothetical protein n=1 Tax=Nocardioides sp. C4-1 TaxID=3151851 RepID=UPI0032643626
MAVGDVSTELPDVLGARATVQAPEGGSFVRVDLDIPDDGLIPLAAVAAPFQQETEVVLRADGREYPLLGPGGPVLDPNGLVGQGGSRWVAVEGEPDELEVAVTVDGLTQTVDAADGSVDNGRAAELADVRDRAGAAGGAGQREGTPCGTPERLDDTALRVSYGRSLECRVRLALRTPYVDGLGWADEGREFVAVQLVQPVRVQLVTGRDDAQVYWDTTTRLDVRLGDAAPLGPEVAVNSLDRGLLAFADPSDPGQLVFDVPADEPLGDLVATLTADATLGEPFPTERRSAVFRWIVAGEDLS